MRILVTEHRGHVGAPVAALLERLGHDVVGYDRLDGDDLLDSAAVRRAADGCAAVVHAIAATQPSLVMAGRFASSVPVRDAACFQDDPWRSLFDWSAAARVLGWQPRYQWSTRGHDQAD